MLTQLNFFLGRLCVCPIFSADKDLHLAVLLRCGIAVRPLAHLHTSSATSPTFPDASTYSATAINRLFLKLHLTQRGFASDSYR